MTQRGVAQTLHGAGLERFQTRYGGLPQINVQPITFAGTANGVPVLAGDAERVFLAFINIGPASIAVLPSPLVGATTGFVLSPNGGAIVVNEQEDSLMPCLDWYAAPPSAGVLLLIVSIRRDVKVAAVQGED